MQDICKRKNLLFATYSASKLGFRQLPGCGKQRRDTVAFESHRRPLFGINDKRHPDGYLLSMAEAVYAESEGELHVV